MSAHRPALPTTAARPVAFVMGDMDLVTPIGRSGIPIVSASAPGTPPARSRYVRRQIDTVEIWDEPEVMVDRLLEAAADEPERPVLFYQGDAEQLMVSRHRDRLEPSFRFVVAGRELCEDLVDKERFAALAERVGLDVPATITLPKGSALPPRSSLDLPALVKPTLRRTHDWQPSAGAAKAVLVTSYEQLEELWAAFETLDAGLVIQELIEGPESRIVSYHVYVDDRGEIAGEFTGRKIRTRPAAFGVSSAVEVLDLPDTLAAGREVIERTGLTGVGKLDFKLGPDGRHRLLEINARFNLWHFPGALAGVNIPALVYADLVGEPRPTTRPVTHPVRWIKPWHDIHAAREAGVGLFSWALFAARCPAKSCISWRDPAVVPAALRYSVFRRRYETDGDG